MNYKDIFSEKNMLANLKQTTFKKMLKHTLPLIFLLFTFFFSTFVMADTIRIGLRAHHGHETSMMYWKKTADYLTKKIPEHEFIMVPFVGLTELMEEAEDNQFDFVITNPSSYVEMELRLGASVILTLRNKRQGKPYTKFGSVIFTHKDNTDINEIKDLKDKRIIAVSEPAFGGWRVVVRELLNEGFDIYKQAKKVSFSGGIQQDVVSIIRLGNADVGVVRTDMLERMAVEGLIKLEDFKIINKKTTKGFPFAHSTQLYPEWAFAKMRDTSNALSKKVALALLTISSQHPAAVAGKYVGWTIPEDYQSVHDLMKDLKLGSYASYNEDPFKYFINEYLVHIIISICIFIILVFITFYILATNRKLLEAKNQQDKLMNELEINVAMRTRELLIAKEQAEKANKAKTEFLSGMSHELRTPMNAILGFAQIIEYDVEHERMDSIKESINEILLAGRHLLDLVNDVLDLAKIETGKYDLDLQIVSVSEVINEVVNLLNVLAYKNQVTIIRNFENNDELSIMVDLRSFRQALINIIANAIKYNKINGDVTIDVHQQDGDCKISIADTGEGIASDALENIFEPFERVSNRSNIEGSGVGLSITKNLIEIMDGKITVESTLGVGSCFEITFRAAN